eukprot:TRINITY_DN81656_c0_g1_i1.p1 TRINITY_DN81656_c0_g1~~TRINITY_DN81656_c0_g1_i1.p1  ORF type:complete len:189 (-),score=52.75 TRINITY_DN81656_c0_g1_i1:92-658(-)
MVALSTTREYVSPQREALIGRPCLTTCSGVMFAILLGCSVPIEQKSWIMEHSFTTEGACDARGAPLEELETAAPPFLADMATCPHVLQDFGFEAEVLDDEEEEANGYSFGGFLRDVRSMISFVLGIFVSSPVIWKGKGGGAQESRSRRSSGQGIQDGLDSATSAADSESEGEEQDESEKKIKLYFYMM